MTKMIQDIHKSKTGKVSDKWQSYLEYYDDIFIPFREKNIALLEIGIQNGGSIETWAKYFEQGDIFIGCDIDENCSRLKFNDRRINIVIGDVNIPFTYKKICEFEKSFDIVIDDGSHVSPDVLNSFVNYFPLLKPGGVYIVEDAHTLYADGFGGGLFNENGAYEFFKKMVDVISFQWWKNEVTINTLLRTFFPLNLTPKFITEGWIESVEFRNSIITIRKSKTPSHEKLGVRMICGQETDVQNWGGGRPQRPY
jgi:hypothetical protein